MAYPTTNKKVIAFVEESAKLACPDQIVWIDGSEAQLDALRKEACETGEIIKLNQEKLPGCYYHRTAENDVARVEARTFICCKDKDNAGPNNYWMDPKEAYAMCAEIARGKMKGRTMYVIPYSMGIVGSSFSKIGIEVTDSIYVVLNMAIMTRVGLDCYEALGEDGDFIKGFHCKCDVDPEKRYIMHFPEDDTIISVNSAYGGNVLLGKKCFALRIASYLGKQEGWMAEHMLILGVTYPDGSKKYIAAAFPSACGKTNLAMLIPPKHYQPRERLLRRRARHQRKEQSQRARRDEKEHHLHQCRDQSRGQHRVVGRSHQTRARTPHRLAGQRVDARFRREGGASQLPFHGARRQLPLPFRGIQLQGRRAARCDRLRRPPRDHHASLLSVPRLGSRRVRRLHHVQRDDGSRNTGSKWARRRPTLPRSSTSTGSVRTRTASSCGRASATTCACSTGS